MLKKYFIAFIAGVFLIIAPKNAIADSTSIQTSEQSLSKIYYFHSNMRCSSCLKIEAYTKEAFDENFKGKLAFEAINISETGNKHFIKDYQLYTKSVVVVKIENGEETAYKNLDKVWNYLGNKEKFKSYVKEETENFLFKQGE
ncbi:MAG: hypothetical protein GY804_13670 [Alphaproteobacteria bacterium]|nr:hypothetical protein [Alphaproteobacteria bacterium]